MRSVCFFFLLIPLQLCGQTQSLEGLVLDTDTKEPLAGVELSLMNGGEVIQTTKTDEKGRYKFLAEPGVHDLRVYKQAYVEQTHRNFTIWAGLGHTFNIDLTFCRGLCSPEILWVQKTSFQLNDTGTSTQFSKNDLLGKH